VAETALPTLTVRGETFEVPEYVAPIALMRYSEGAVRGIDSSSPEGMAAMYVVLRACIVADDWDRFEQLALRERLTHTDLLEVVTQAFEVISDRPTERPSDSSDGPRDIEPRSEDDSSSRIIRRLEEAGRPDWALVVQETQEAKAG
jgi:hypothetical protein